MLWCRLIEQHHRFEERFTRYQEHMFFVRSTTPHIASRAVICAAATANATEHVPLICICFFCQIFRNYRSHFEQQKTRIVRAALRWHVHFVLEMTLFAVAAQDARYRELVENAVKDALQLSAENARLKTQLAAELRNRLGAGPGVIPSL